MSPTFCFEENPFQKSGQSSNSGRMPLKSLRVSRAVLHQSRTMSRDGRFDSVSGKCLLSNQSFLIHLSQLKQDRFLVTERLMACVWLSKNPCTC